MTFEPSTVVVEQPFDWIAGVLVPVAAILVSAGLAIGLAALERRASERGHIRAQAAELIRALSAMGRAALEGDDSEKDRASARYEEELNAFGAHLNRRDIVVAKFVCVIVTRADEVGEVDEMAGARFSRTMLWLSTAVELWVRGTIRSSAFAENMPNDTTSWVEAIDLGHWDAVVRGKPTIGVADIDN